MAKTKKITIDDLAIMVQKGFENTATKEQFVALEERMGNMEIKMGGMETKMGGMEKDVKDIKFKLSDIASDVSKLDRRVDFVESVLNVPAQK